MVFVQFVVMSLVTAEDVGKGLLLFPSLPSPFLLASHFLLPPHFPFLPFTSLPSPLQYMPLLIQLTGLGTGRVVQGKLMDNGNEQELQPIR